MERQENPASVWRAAKRGALLGVYVAVAVNVAVIPLAIYAAMTSPSARDDLFEEGVLRTLGGYAGGIALMTAYLATAGAIIMATVRFVRSRRRA